MSGRTKYLNTDLDLTSADDLTPLAEALRAGGVFALHVTHRDGKWRARFETEEHFTEPEPNIAAVLAVVESLPDHLLAVWDGCTHRGFNIGYDCGDRPSVFMHGLPVTVLERMAKAGTELWLTLYPSSGGDDEDG